jgi:outer membrane protein assembly factor BamB
MGAVWAVLCAFAASASAAIPAWTTYRHDGARSGIDPDSSSPVAPSQIWQSQALDGQVYGQPLVYGSRVYVATENDTVYALDAATGAVVWHRHLATAVDSTALPCGNISPTVGITSTPAIDPATGRIYVVADTWDGSNASSVAHEMYGLNLSDGSVGVGPVGVDAPGSVHTDQLQRTSLALDAGKVVIGYGANSGDCGTYHGWLVAVPESGGSLQTFEADSQSGDSGGAIWASGNAPAVDSSGHIWISTGNGNSGSTFDFSESVIELDSNLNMLQWWAPSTWSSLDGSDLDIGSSMPVLLPGGLAFEIGKQGVGYLLDSASLGGTGAKPLYSHGVCGGSWGGGIYVNGVIYVTCSNGLHALELNTTTSPPSFAPLAGWTVNGAAVASPIFAGGLVWAGGSSLGTNNGTINGVNPTTGKTSFSANLGGLEDFGTAGAGGGRLFVPNQDQTVSGVDQITAIQIANTPSPSPTSVGLSSSANPAAAGAPVTFTATISPGPDAGTVDFTDGGAPIAGCVTVAISPASNRAQCTTTFSAVGAHLIRAAYSGDQYYLASSGALTETVSAPAGSGLSLTGVRVRVVHRKLRLRFTLSQPAKLRVEIFKLKEGRIVDGRCRAGAKHGRRCHALRHRRTLHVFAQSGQHRFRPHMRRLPPGRYAIMFRALGADGQRSNSVTVVVEVRRPPGPHPTARIALQTALLGLSLL